LAVEEDADVVVMIGGAGGEEGHGALDALAERGGIFGGRRRGIGRIGGGGSECKE
jgi:hypothetical protein